MDAKQTIYVLISSALVFATVYLAVRWWRELWDAVLWKITGKFPEQMRSVALDTSRLPMLLRWWGIALGTLLFVCTFVLRIPLIGIALAYFVLIAPGYYLEFVVAQRRSLLHNQLVGAAVALANATRAGLALAQGLKSISEETPVPLALEFRRIVNDYDRGRPLPEMLRESKNRLQLDSFTLFATALITCLDRGGKVTEALERISKSLEENQRLERKLEADTATGRKVVVILTLFPLVFLLGFYMMDPGSTGILFSTVLGQLVVIVVLVLMYISAWWAKKILTIDL